MPLPQKILNIVTKIRYVLKCNMSYISPLSTESTSDTTAKNFYILHRVQSFSPLLMARLTQY